MLKAYPLRSGSIGFCAEEFANYQCSPVAIIIAASWKNDRLMPRHVSDARFRDKEAFAKYSIFNKAT